MKPIVRQVKLKSPYSPWYLAVVLSTPEIKRVRPVAIPCSGVQKNYLVGSYPVVGFHLVGRTDDLTLAERCSVLGLGARRAPDAVSHILGRIEPFAIARLAAHVASLLVACRGRPPDTATRHISHLAVRFENR